MKVRIKKGSKKVYLTVYQKGLIQKVPIYLVADAFKTYNESMQLASLLYEAFSEEGAMARKTALKNLETRLDKLGLRSRFDWQDAFNVYENHSRTN